MSGYWQSKNAGYGNMKRLQACAYNTLWQTCFAHAVLPTLHACTNVQACRKLCCSRKLCCLNGAASAFSQYRVYSDMHWQANTRTCIHTWSRTPTQGIYIQQLPAGYSLQVYRLLQTTVADTGYAMQVQRVQRHLLRMIHADHPDLMYPAALGCLADLEEVIKLNNLLCRTDALPQSCALDAASSIIYGHAALQGYLQPVFGPVDIKPAPATQFSSHSVVIAWGCRLWRVLL